MNNINLRTEVVKRDYGYLITLKQVNLARAQELKEQTYKVEVPDSSKELCELQMPEGNWETVSFLSEAVGLATADFLGDILGDDYL